MRIIVILGYPPILWFDDSYNYIYRRVYPPPGRYQDERLPVLLQLLLPCTAPIR